MKIRSQNQLAAPTPRSLPSVSNASASPLHRLSRLPSPLFNQSTAGPIRLNASSSEATALGYTAFTRGDEVHFAPGEYQPHTSEGQEIIAHEAVHVRQQAKGRARLGGGFADAGTLERQAQVRSPMVSAAPFGMVQGYSVAGAGGGGGKAYVPYEFKSKLFTRLEDPAENTLRSWYFGGHAQGFEYPYEAKAQLEAKQTLQMALNLINKDPEHRSSEIYLDPDGEFGSNTDKVIRAFQKKHGLNPDGVIGEQTAKMMDEILAELEFERKPFVVNEKTSKIKGEQNYNIYGSTDEWERGHQFYFEIVPALDKGKPAESVGWNAVNAYLQTKHVAEYLQAMGLLEKDAKELERQRLIHYRFKGWDEQEHVQQWIGETPEMQNESGYESAMLHVTDRFSDRSLPKTIKAIVDFQRKYGFPQTGRLVKGTKEYEVFEKVGLDAWCKMMGVGKYG